MSYNKTQKLLQGLHIFVGVDGFRTQTGIQASVLLKAKIPGAT